MMTVLVALLAIGTATFVVARLLMRSRSSDEPRSRSRFRAHLDERSDYIVYVAIFDGERKHWERVNVDPEADLRTPSGRSISFDDVRGFVIAYPNRQILDAELGGLAPPDGLSVLRETGHLDRHPFFYDELVAGQGRLRVEYGPSPAHPNDPSHYRTTLVNVSDEPIRVAGFSPATVELRGTTPPRRTQHGRLYTNDDFVNWYGAEANGWLEPGGSASDPNNWGAPPIVWVYYCETLQGDRFSAGGLLRS